MYESRWFVRLDVIDTDLATELINSTEVGRAIND